MNGRIVLLSGGVGGAKLALGLRRIVAPGAMTVIANTGDDFDHLGLRICPDIDTLLYTLADLADTERGWGRGDESWSFMAALADLGGEDWFSLGDRDLALHVLRTRALATGRSLSDFVRDMAMRLGISHRIVPMSDDPVRTMIATCDGEIAFQDYFVCLRCKPRTEGIRFAGAERATMSAAAAAALRDPGLAAIVVAPSNPYLSIDPILQVPGMIDHLRAASAPVVAVSPIIDGAAIKGPTAKIMAERGLAPSTAAVIDHYGDLIDGWLVDDRDLARLDDVRPRVAATDTLMRDLADRERVARAVLALAAAIGRN